MKNFLIGFLIVIYAVFVAVLFCEQDNIVDYLNGDNRAKLLKFKAENKEKLQEANEKVEHRQYKMSTIDDATVIHYVDAHSDNYIVTGTMGNKNVKYEFGSEPSYNNEHGVDFYEHNRKIYATKDLLVKDLKSDNEMEAEDRYSDYYGSDGLDAYYYTNKETYTDRKDSIRNNVNVDIFAAELIVGVILSTLICVILTYL